jgi:lipopolysaccharide transport system permease protein
MSLAPLADPYRLIYRHRRVLFSAVRAALKARYAGSILGLGWVVVGPLLLLALYAFVYAVVFRIRPAGLALGDYILYIFAGLIPFIAFSQALAAGTQSLSADVALLQNKLFPAELIPLREVLAAGTQVLVGLAVVIAIRLALGGPSWAWLLLPAVLLFLLLGTIAAVWAFALLNLAMRDVQQVVTLIVMLLLVASPIAYTPEMLPPQFKALLYLNPLAYFVTSLQSILVLGTLPSPGVLAGGIAISLVAFHGMYYVFSKAKRVIVDLL